MKEKIIKAKWRKSESGGWNTIDVDANIWCPCDTEYKQTLYCQNERTVTCPMCGRVFRVVTRVVIQEQVRE